jgi:hypothetical protein
LRRAPGFFAAFRFIGPVRATMLSNIEPLLGALFAVAVLGESLNSLQWTGVALAVAALVLLRRPHQGKAQNGTWADRRSCSPIPALPPQRRQADAGGVKAIAATGFLYSR